jgi:hypothetical protein
MDAKVELGFLTEKLKLAQNGIIHVILILSATESFFFEIIIFSNRAHSKR